MMKNIRNITNTNPPLPGEIAEGQMAIGMLDGQLWSKDNNGDIIPIGGNLYTVATIADLSTAPVQRIVFVSDPLRGGLFVHNASMIDENDGIFIIDGFERKFSSAIDVRWGGAVKDTDSSAQIQSLIDKAAAQFAKCVIDFHGLNFNVEANNIVVDHDHVLLINGTLTRTGALTGYTVWFGKNVDTVGGGVKHFNFKGRNTIAAMAGLSMGSTLNKSDKYVLEDIESSQHGQYGVAINNGSDWVINDIRVLDHGYISGALSSCMGFYIFPKHPSRNGVATNIYSEIGADAIENDELNAAAIKIQTHQNISVDTVTAIGGKEEAISVDSISGIVTNIKVYPQGGRPGLVVGNYNPSHSFSGQEFTVDTVKIYGESVYGLLIGGGDDGESKFKGCTIKNVNTKFFSLLNLTSYENSKFSDIECTHFRLSTKEKGYSQNSRVPSRNIFRNITAQDGSLWIQTNDSTIENCKSLNGDIRLIGSDNHTSDLLTGNSPSNGVTIDGDNNTIDAEARGNVGRSIWIKSGTANYIKNSYLFDGTRILDNGTDTIFENRNKIVAGLAAPAVGNWVKGDTVVQYSPSANGKHGWRCTDSGAPGTWNAFGAIDE